MGKFLLVMLVVAVAIYVVVRLVQTRGRPFGGTTAGRPPIPGPGTGPSRPLGPDDDPEFLRDLNRRRWRDRRNDDRPES